MQPAPIDDLLTIQALVQRHGSPELAERLRKRMTTYFAGGCTLDEAMEVNGKPSERRAVTRYHDQQRLQYLSEAWEIIGPDLFPWPRAGKLAEAITEFQSRIWPVWREHESPPPGASQLRAALFMARKHGELPEGQRRLHELLKASTETSAAAWFSRPPV